MPYAVTRQSYWPEGQLAVEVAGGGLDYCNPDALVGKYPGEFEEFLDPREAVKTAIEICREWRADLKGKRQGWPTVRVGLHPGVYDSIRGGNVRPRPSLGRERVGIITKVRRLRKSAPR